MRQKEKTHDTVIRQDKREADGYRYGYELIMRVSESLVSMRIPLYSIKATLIDPYGKETCSEIKDAFADAGRAILFYERVVRNLATPIDLSYIHEDEIC